MPKRKRIELPTPKQRPSLSRLSEREIGDCLKRAFDSLSDEDQANIKRAIAPLLDIRNMGLTSALRVLFVTSQGAALDRLDAAVSSSVPQEAVFETDCAGRN